MNTIDEDGVVHYLSKSGRPAPWVCLVATGSRHERHYVQYALFSPKETEGTFWKGTVSADIWEDEDIMLGRMRGVATKAANRKHWELTQGKYGPLAQASAESVAQWVYLESYSLRRFSGSVIAEIRQAMGALLTLAESVHLEEKAVPIKPFD